MLINCVHLCVERIKENSYDNYGYTEVRVDFNNRYVHDIDDV